jgi:NRPS condensation-like uncharacterized protein/acyl carrier protein
MSELDAPPSAFWQGVRANHKLQHQTPAIQPRPHNDTIPLTFGQERLWWIDHLQPGTTAHNLRAVIRLHGRLNLAALEQSLHEIVRRHDILRTRFPTVAEQPVQVIEPVLKLELPLVDLTALPDTQREAEVHRLAAAEAQQPFDLAQGPLIRFKLLRLAEYSTILIRTIHHIINDRWSDSVFIGELAALYEAFSQGEPSPLPDLPIQYADFAHAQRQWLQGDVLNTQLDYWRQQLGGQLSPLELPTGAASAAGPGYQGGTQYLTVTAESTAALKRLAHRSGVSLFVVLLAAYKALLYRYSGQDDISLCVPVAGRNRAETRKLIGYFTNLVLVRTSLQGDPTLSDLVNRVSQATLGAFEHQALPLQQIAEALNIPGSVLGRALFTLQNVPAWPTEMAGIRIVPLDIPEGISNFDLSLSMKMQSGNLLGILRYKTDIFQAEPMAEMLEQFQCLLHDLAANPERHLSALPPLIAAQCLATNTGTASEASAYVAPHTELEHTVATIWQTVLRRDRISVEANFFELGGRSLDLVQVRSKLQDEVHQDIPLRELLNRPTIRLLARYLHQQRAMHQSVARHTHQRAQNQRRALQQQKEQMQRRRKLDG